MHGLTRYQVMDVLGSGSQGTSYRAIDRQTGKAVALKVFALRESASWGAFERFEHERDVLRGLDHPGIIRLLDSFAHEEQGEHYLVLELVEGQSLQAMIDRHVAVPPDLAQRLLGEGLSILQYLHTRKPPVIHRDIKPAHLIVTPEQHLRLVDFGAIGLAAMTSGLTVIGTPGYSAPEQAHGTFGPSSDLYALGTSLCAALVGRPIETLPRLGLEVDLSGLRLPPALAHVLRGMTRADPRERLASAEQALTLLRVVPTQAATTATHDHTTPNHATHQAHDVAVRPDEVPSLARFVGTAVANLDQIGSRGLRVIAWIAMTVLTWFFAGIEMLLLPFAFRVADEWGDDQRPAGSKLAPELVAQRASKRGQIRQEVQKTRRALKAAADRLEHSLDRSKTGRLSD